MQTAVRQLDSAPTSHPLANGEHLLSLADAGRYLPGSRGCNHVNPATVFRWVTRGVRALNGTRVKLEAVRAGSRWLTSAEALTRFTAALSAQPQPVSPRPQTPSRRAATAAGEALAQMGI